MAILKQPVLPVRTSSLRRCYHRFRHKDVMADAVIKLGTEPTQLAPVVPVAPQINKRDGTSTGLLDLEKELTCSICTDILYQPLTLLDCLHTFCGGCLKEWFKWQGISTVQKHEAERGYTNLRISNPYTCPSCRAPVRETRPNASITTLLEMWLQANPGKDKSEEEKHEVAKQYSKGENVLIDIRELRRSIREARRPRRTGTESDVEGVDMTVNRDVSGNSSLRDTSERTRQGTGESSGEESRRRRRGRREDERDHGRGDSSTRNGGTGQDVQWSVHSNIGLPNEHRVLEHQSSLRSLFSVADMDSHEMEQQILRQIMEEGLLDGVDLSTMDVHQEEELSERIARAFRRRQREQQRERRQESEQRRAATEAARVRDERQQERDRGQERQSRPPVSRPRLLEAAASGGNAQHRASSQGSNRRSSRPEDGIHRQADSRSPQPASNSLLDLSLRTRSRDRSENTRLRLSSRERSSTNPESRSISEAWRATGVPADTLRPSNGRPLAAVEGQHRSIGPRRGSQSSLHQSSGSSSNSSLTAQIIPSTQTPTVILPAGDGLSAACAVPQISCVGCSKLHIEHDLHYVCNMCPASNGNNTYALCLRCYRVGKGCHHWLGFGHAATARYERQVASGKYLSGNRPPHVMVPERYIPAVKYEHSRLRTQVNQDGVKQRGKFCDICFQQSNKCHWSCDICNDGEWGYCTACVNQARHCTHPLLPFQYILDKNRSETGTPPYHAEPAAVSLFARCTECHMQIPSMQPLFHCTSCNSGDYNVCLSCYSTLTSSNRISLQNGPQGWRRCPQGHRMLVISYDEPNSNDLLRQRRILLQGVVGGWALHDGEDGQGMKERNQDGEREAAAQFEQDREAKSSSPTLQRWSWRDPEAGGGWKHKKRQVPRDNARRPSTSASTDGPGASVPATSNVPPSGGYGMKMQALWSRIPDEYVEDELAFPRGAVVEEVVDINGDWCWGVYCRKTGLFPGTWARVV